MSSINSTLGHSLEAYLRGRDVVYGNSSTKPLAKYPNRIKLRTHRRMVNWGDEFSTFRRYKTKGEM